jgi:hypothetical protein
VNLTEQSAPEPETVTVTLADFVTQAETGMGIMNSTARLSGLEVTLEALAYDAATNAR